MDSCYFYWLFLFYVDFLFSFFIDSSAFLLIVDHLLIFFIIIDSFYFYLYS